MMKIEDFQFFGICVLDRMQYFVYILISEMDRSFYFGQTQDIEKRIKRHIAGLNKATSAKRPWRLIYNKVCETRSDALKFEKYLKGLKNRSAVLKWIEKEIRGVAQPG